MSGAPPRVLVTKIGLDGHDRGSRIVAAYLRDAGMEVIYTPPWQSIAAVVASISGVRRTMSAGVVHESGAHPSWQMNW